MTENWPVDVSPYHEGERSVQTRAGGREIAERVGRRVIRDHMIEQHRTFFADLTYAFLGTSDRNDRPWATILTGARGFLSAPDPRVLVVAAMPSSEDPAFSGLFVGAPVSLLGIDLGNRRRNRLTGRVGRIGRNGFDIRVDLSFGNCPQYVNARRPLEPPPDRPARADRITPGDPWIEQLIARTDTCFLASASGRRESPFEGSDVNHRGGPPGFLGSRLSDGKLIVTLPDYPGNRAFSNFGNIAVNPKAGMVLPDFTTGDALTLSGNAWIEWSGPDRQLHVETDTIFRLSGLLPAAWTDAEPAPQFTRLAREEHPAQETPE